MAEDFGFSFEGYAMMNEDGNWDVDYHTTHYGASTGAELDILSTYLGVLSGFLEKAKEGAQTT